MDAKDFQNPLTPGRLEPTTFLERQAGLARPVSVVGLGYVPHPLPSGLTKADLAVPLIDLLMEAQQNLCLLEGVSRQITNPGLLIGPLARQEARKSSAIENTFASEQQLALFEVDDSQIGTDDREEVRDVSNYLAALRQGFDDPRPICLSLIRDLHATLLKKSTRISGRPGEFRTNQNAIGDRGAPFRDARFVPPPPRFLDQCLNELETFIHAPSDIPFLIRAAMIHYQFECIHPFDDGNGRIGRLLAALQLCKGSGSPLKLPLVYISGPLEKDRDDYYALLYRVSSSGAWLDWISFFLSAVAHQAKDALARVEKLDQLRTQYHERVRRKRASAMLPKLIDYLFNKPAITVANAMQVAGMGAASAGKLIDRLAEADILREVTGRKHSRIFLAREIINISDTNFDDKAATSARASSSAEPPQQPSDRP